jgi:hypothetical protein
LKEIRLQLCSRKLEKDFRRISHAALQLIDKVDDRFCERRIFQEARVVDNDLEHFQEVGVKFLRHGTNQKHFSAEKSQQMGKTKRWKKKNMRMQ